MRGSILLACLSLWAGAGACGKSGTRARPPADAAGDPTPPALVWHPHVYPDRQLESVQSAFDSAVRATRATASHARLGALGVETLGAPPADLTGLVILPGPLAITLNRATDRNVLISEAVYVPRELMSEPGAFDAVAGRAVSVSAVDAELGYITVLGGAPLVLP